MDSPARGRPLGAARGVRVVDGRLREHGHQELRRADALRRRRSRCSSFAGGVEEETE